MAFRGPRAAGKSLSPTPVAKPLRKKSETTTEKKASKVECHDAKKAAQGSPQSHDKLSSGDSVNYPLVPLEAYKPQRSLNDILGTLSTLAIAVPSAEELERAQPDENHTESMRKKRNSAVKALERLNVIPKTHCADIGLQADSGTIAFLQSELSLLYDLSDKMLKEIETNRWSISAKAEELGSLREMCNSQTSTIQDLKNKLSAEHDSHEEVLAQNKQKFFEMKATQSELKAKATQLCNKIHRLEDNLRESERKARESNENASEKEFVVHEMETKLSELKHSLVERSRALSDREKHLREKTATLNEIEGTFDGIKKQLQEAVEKKEKAEADSNKKIQQLETALRSAKAETQAATIKLAEHEETTSIEMQSLREKLMQVEQSATDSERLRQYAAELETRMEQMQPELKEASSDLQKIKDDYEDITKTCAELQKQNSALIGELENSEVTLRQLSENAKARDVELIKAKNDLNMMCQAKDRATKDLMSSRKRHKGAMTRVLQQLIIANEEKGQLVKELKESNKKLTPKIQQLLCTTEDCLLLDQERNQLMHINEDLKLNLATVKSDLDRTEEQISSMTEQLIVYENYLKEQGTLDSLPLIYRPELFGKIIVEETSHEEGPSETSDVRAEDDFGNPVDRRHMQTPDARDRMMQKSSDEASESERASVPSSFLHENQCESNRMSTSTPERKPYANSMQIMDPDSDTDDANKSEDIEKHSDEHSRQHEPMTFQLIQNSCANSDYSGQ